MVLLVSLSRRSRQPEVMDQPGLAPDLHAQALAGLERINWWSRSAAILWPPLHAVLTRAGGRPVRLLDVATGAGDVVLGLWRKARRQGLPLQIEGCDCSATAVAHAQRRAAQQQCDARFFTCDALAGPLPGEPDVITCSLFLHHLEAEQAVGLLRRFASAARQLVLVNDLCRSQAGLLLAHAATRVLTRSAIVHTDGPRSVRAAFTPAEARELARRAGLRGVSVVRRWPCRWLLRFPVDGAPVRSSE